ncbi:MAG: NYN domain-containing protein [Nitrospirota bacterium]
MKKIAIFVDWENLRQRVFVEASTVLGKKINYNHIPNVIKLITSFVEPNEEIHRIFFYLAKPFGETVNGVDYSQTSTYQNSVSFIKKLAIQDNIAVRKGYLAIRGYDKNNQPIFVQKQVDMLIGLDIAHISHHKHADRVLILSADTDIIPAMKTARINGLQVVYGYCSDIQGNDIHRKLKEHSDFIRERDFGSIFNKPS